MTYPAVKELLLLKSHGWMKEVAAYREANLKAKKARRVQNISDAVAKV